MVRGHVTALSHISQNLGNSSKEMVMLEREREREREGRREERREGVGGRREGGRERE